MKNTINRCLYLRIIKSLGVAITMKARIKNIQKAIIRSLLQLKRPAPASNFKKLNDSGHSLNDFKIRDATQVDIPALSRLHVQAWKETYWTVKNPPTYATREYQWNEQFRVTDGSWFCLVVEDKNGQLVGFAKGKSYRGH